MLLWTKAFATSSPLENPVKALVSIIKEVQSEATTGKKTNWRNTPLEVVKLVSNSVVGKSGELFNIALFTNCNLKVQKHSVRGEHDLIVNGIKIEVKTATKDTSGSFQFNGIRHDRKYDMLSVLGIAPQKIYFRFYHKSALTNERMVLIAKNIKGNHKMTRRPSKLWNIKDFCDKANEFFN